MALVLSISDNADGTGAVATISGSSAGATNTVFAGSWTGSMESVSMASAGSRISDGAVPIAQAVGYWIWQVVSVLAGVTTVSNLVYQNVTETDPDGVHHRCLESCAIVVRSLGLPSITADDVLKKWWPRYVKNADPALPIVCVSPVGAEDYPGIMTNRDDVAYPVLVSVIDALNNDSVANMQRDLLWRQKISRAFRFQRLPGVVEIINTQIMPDQILNLGAYEIGYLLSAVLFRFVSREVRGLS